MPPIPDQDFPRPYAIRITPDAVNDVDFAVSRLNVLAGDAVGAEWRAQLRSEFGRISANPRQFPLIAEARFVKREVRYLIYR